MAGVGTFEVEGPPQGVVAQRYGEATPPELVDMFLVLLRKNFLMMWKKPTRLLSLLLSFSIMVAATVGVYLGMKSALEDSYRDMEGSVHENLVAMTLQSVMAMVAPIFICISQILALQSLVPEMTTDKETKMKAVQLVNGVPPVVYWAGYFAYYMIIISAGAVALTLAMCLTCMQKSSPILLLVSFGLSYMHMFGFGAILVTVFERARTASIVLSFSSYLALVAPVVGAFRLAGQLSLSGPVHFLLGALPSYTLGNIVIGTLVLELGGYNAKEHAGTELYRHGCEEKAYFLPGKGWNFKTLLDFPDYSLLGDCESRTDFSGPGTNLALLVVQTPLVLLLAFWLDQVWQGDFGAAKPKCFCLMPRYWGSRRQARDIEAPLNPQAASAALEISGLVKEFRRGKETFRAVDDMNLTVKKAEVFALLGHNGAGKTTAISCVVGMMAPTSGDAFVFGHSCTTDAQRARWNLSICPQDNPMYELMTVDQHLRFFGALRGCRDLEREIPDVLQLLGLTDKRFCLGGSLSGGQKRRLWVATSLLGSAPVVFLDEPTSGMDPASRRELWDLLLSMRDRGRTIIFTTHYLEEADLLAERKAILSRGRVQAVGSSRELKMQFGAGYHLRVMIPRSLKTDSGSAITEVVTSHVEGASVESVADEEVAQAGDTPVTLSYTLPFSKIDMFGPLLTQLDEQKGKLGIIDYEVVATSLEEVFMALGKQEEMAHVAPGGQIAVEFQEVEADRVDWERVEVQWSKHVMAVARLRLREICAERMTVVRSLVVPMLLNMKFFWLTASPEPNGVGQAMDSGGLGAAVPVLAMAIPVSVFMVALVRERVSKAKHVMVAQGLPLSAYWGGSFLEHYAQLALIAVSVQVMSVVTSQSYLTELKFDKDSVAGIPGAYTLTHDRAPIAFMASLIAPLPMLLACYHASYAFQTVEGVLRAAAPLIMLLGMLPAIVLQAFLLFAPVLTLRLHKLLSLVSPFYTLPGTMIGLWWQCNSNNKESGVWTVPGRSCKADAFAYLAAPDAFLPMFGGLLLSGVLFALLVWRDSFSATAPLGVPDPGEPSRRDQDVLDEEQRVAAASPHDEACLYRGLRHTFHTGGREVKAVRGISLGVKTGECFGLLGPNGAGKTTTLGCLTGEIRPPTCGEVYVTGHSVTSDGIFQAFKNIGFCPQVDPLIPLLSGRDHLLFFGLVKGVPADRLDAEVDRLLARLGFQSADALKSAGTYSGGMKRKLSLAIALIGGSPVMFLDEPSAAVDAAAKRHLWKVIKRRRAQQTVVVTTHSMEEAEALCDRLAIQVLGQLRCLGTPMRIKGLYGAGYQLEIFMDMKRGGARQSFSEGGSFSNGAYTCAGGQQEAALTAFVHEALTPEAALLECHSGRYLYQLPAPDKGGINLGQVFSRMQAARGTRGIEDYSVTQPSLEQVFLRFAKEQQEGVARPEEGAAPAPPP